VYPGAANPVNPAGAFTRRKLRDMALRPEIRWRLEVLKQNG
jgi:hypothetical protein